MKYNTAIHNAFLKYGQAAAIYSGGSNFTLDVLEYCEDVDPIIREQYYLDLLKPSAEPKNKQVLR